MNYESINEEQKIKRQNSNQPYQSCFQEFNFKKKQTITDINVSFFENDFNQNDFESTNNHSPIETDKYKSSSSLFINSLLSSQIEDLIGFQSGNSTKNPLLQENNILNETNNSINKEKHKTNCSSEVNAYNNLFDYSNLSHESEKILNRYQYELIKIKENFNSNINKINNNSNNKISIYNIDDSYNLTNINNINDYNLNLNLDFSERKQISLSHPSFPCRKHDISQFENENKEYTNYIKTFLYDKHGWKCLSCRNFNYETRIKCNKCGKFPLNEKESLKEKRIGDWLCNICNNHNFSFRTSCNRCGSSKNYIKNNIN
jgi:hypothetical protein